MPDFKARLDLLQSMIDLLKEHVDFTSMSYVPFHGPGSKSESKAPSSKQQLAATGLREAKKDIEAAIAVAAFALKEIDRIMYGERPDHQCYTGKDSRCLICGREL